MTLHQTELMRQHEAHKARQARMSTVKPEPKPASEEVRKIYVRQLLPKIPLWRQKDIYFDDHCENWKMRREMHSSPSSYLRRRCTELKVPYPMMVGASRIVEISLRRHLIIWEMMQRFTLSFPQMGRLFNRDHTSILHGYRRMQAMSAAERRAIGPVKSQKRINLNQR